jgi:O-antigen ligase
MQTTGKDFVDWNNPYNSLIGTVGNPNFAAALMAVMGVIIFSTIFNSGFKIQLRIYGAIMAALLLIAIYKSNARQGLISYFLGVGIFLVIWLWGKSKKLGIIATLIGSGIFIFSVLGMLQIGPFEKYLYKASVSIRGYYWRAGIEMLSNHPFFGVGIDRYGAYFKEYREIKYPLTYGFELTSTNAHNTFIQL